MKITINGTLANIDAVFNTSNARSPPTNINENGNKHSANAQNNLLARNGSPITFSEKQPLKYMILNRMLSPRIKRLILRTAQSSMTGMVNDALLQ